MGLAGMMQILGGLLSAAYVFKVGIGLSFFAAGSWG